MVTPTVIPLSATLNAGQWYPATWKSRKSATAPKRSRSTTFPRAPPITKPMADASQTPWTRRSQTTRAATMASATSGRIQTLIAESPSNRPKLMPRFHPITRLKNGVN